MSFLVCPSCKKDLVCNDKSYVCENKHTYDRAKNGYVNLLLSNQKNAKDPGDTKEMCVSRERFLEKGYYGELKDTVCNIINKYTTSIKGKCNILDGGCGEGYYTNSIINAINNNNAKIEMVGVDISKHAVNIANRKNKQVKYAVASLFHLPIADKSCDIFINMFAPFCAEEIQRVLKKDGVMIMAIPDRRHLFSLKEFLYDNPYENEVKEFELAGFTLVNSTKVSCDISIDNNEDIKSLFGMTPYFWRTPKESIEKLNSIEKLDTKGEFIVLEYKTQV